MNGELTEGKEPNGKGYEDDVDDEEDKDDEKSGSEAEGAVDVKETFKGGEFVKESFDSF